MQIILRRGQLPMVGCVCVKVCSTQPPSNHVLDWVGTTFVCKVQMMEENWFVSRSVAMPRKSKKSLPSSSSQNASSGPLRPTGISRSPHEAPSSAVVSEDSPGTCSRSQSTTTWAITWRSVKTVEWGFDWERGMSFWGEFE